MYPDTPVFGPVSEYSKIESVSPQLRMQEVSMEELVRLRGCMEEEGRMDAEGQVVSVAEGRVVPMAVHADNQEISQPDE
jgi:hypothetical protein